MAWETEWTEGRGGYLTVVQLQAQLLLSPFLDSGTHEIRVTKFWVQRKPF